MGHITSTCNDLIILLCTLCTPPPDPAFCFTHALATPHAQMQLLHFHTTPLLHHHNPGLTCSRCVRVFPAPSPAALP
jgi:hypothetical protein